MERLKKHAVCDPREQERNKRRNAPTHHLGAWVVAMSVWSLKSPVHEVFHGAVTPSTTQGQGDGWCC